MGPRESLEGKGEGSGERKEKREKWKGKTVKRVGG
jgi:hypothetical protein